MKKIVCFLLLLAFGAHGIAVDTETERSSQNNVEHFVPIVVVMFEQCKNIFCFSLQSFAEQSIEPWPLASSALECACFGI